MIVASRGSCGCDLVLLPLDGPVPGHTRAGQVVRAGSDGVAAGFAPA